MHVPKGKPVHEHLKTSYVNTAALLADLQVTGFTGYLQLTFPYSCGYVFINAGAILNAFEEDAERRRRGAEAIDAILLRASSPDGEVSVYAHAGAVVEAISGRIDGESVYQKLESEFTDLKRLVGRLAQQGDARFYVEVELGAQGDGIIYIVDGNIDAVISLANGEIIEGEAGYERILVLVAEQKALFHVYRCAREQAAISSIALGGANNIIAFPDLNPPVAEAAPVAEYEEEMVAQEGMPGAGIMEEASPYAESDAAVDDGADYREQYESLIALMSEITHVIERAAALVAKESNFAVALRAGLLEVTEQYPFFDPFAAEFEYSDGKIKFSAAPPPVDFVIGLTQALKRAVRELEQVVPSIDLRHVVADALARLQQLRQAEFARFGLAPAVAEIVAVD